MAGRICLYYSQATLTYQLSLLLVMYMFNVSMIRSADIMTFLMLFTPLVMFGSYVLLRILSRMDGDRRRRNELSEVMLLVFSIAAFLCGAAVFYGLTVLLGAPLFEDVEETFSFSCLCSSLTVFPLFVINEARWDEFLNYLPEVMNVRDSLEDAVKIVCCFTVIGAWCGAFPIPLDWDRDWQVWPITCCVGSLSGHLIGLLYVVLASSGIFPSNQNDDWKHKIT